jgi:hypothetical protein
MVALVIDTRTNLKQMVAVLAIATEAIRTSGRSPWSTHLARMARSVHSAR